MINIIQEQLVTKKDLAKVLRVIELGIKGQGCFKLGELASELELQFDQLEVKRLNYNKKGKH